MFDEQHGHVEFGAQPADEVLQVDLFLGVEAGGGLVQHQQPRPGDHAAGDFQPALMAVGQVAGLAVGVFAQAHEVQPLGGMADGLGFGTTVGRQTQQACQQAALHLGVLGHKQVFQYGELLEEAHVLEGAHQAVTGHLMAGLARDLVAIQPDAAPGGPVEPADAVEDGGLAGAVGADDGEDLVGGDRQRHAIDGQQAAKAHGEVLHGQQGAGCAGAVRGVHGIVAHRVSSTCGRLTGSSPSGRQIIISTITRPKISIR